MDKRTVITLWAVLAGVLIVAIFAPETEVSIYFRVLASFATGVLLHLIFWSVVLVRDEIWKAKHNGTIIKVNGKRYATIDEAMEAYRD